MFLQNTPADHAKVYYLESFAVEELNFQISLPTMYKILILRDVFFRDAEYTSSSTCIHLCLFEVSKFAIIIVIVIPYNMCHYIFS